MKIDRTDLARLVERALQNGQTSHMQCSQLLKKNFSTLIATLDELFRKLQLTYSTDKTQPEFKL
ncbi:hypothetical protein KKI93_11350 [Xenorhabdus bovienii]|uniref:hypothetical protein n=1 Tax=Xenorhabdus bovienii TaxID=40576 RepID=UPI0023B2C280|nr:hypothetical protein [Xenorhabdus bovienii]MDE9564643.1 hypothetical protein [Xenorhabdus bovienii]